MNRSFARKLYVVRGIGGPNIVEADDGPATDEAPEHVAVREVDMTRVRIGMGMTLVGAAALTAGVLYSMPLAIGGGLLALTGPMIALSGIGSENLLSEGGGV